MPFRAENRHTTLSLLAIVMGILLAGAGMLFYLAERENDRDDARDAARDAADRAYADCLTDFASDLVSTLKVRTDATTRLERVEQRLEVAEDARSEAADTVFRIVALARRDPPEATEKQFDAALAAQVDAQRRYADVKALVTEVRAEVDEVRDQNRYESPKVACDR